jgi:uncharacterized membrane protein YgcG
MTPTIPSTNLRRGIAPLEFVMALPLLFLLMLCIIWEGYWLIGRAEVTITARNDAWKQRFDNLADNPLSFPILPDHDLPVLPKYNATADYAKKEATKKIEVSPAFDSVPGPKSAHTILAGSWDFKAMPLDTPPSFALMAKAGLIGSFGAILDIVSAGGDPIGLIKKFAEAKSEAGRIGSETKSNTTNVGKGGGDSGSGGGSGTGGSGGGGEMTPEQAQQKAEKDLEEEKRKLKERFKQLGGRVNAMSSDTKVNPYTGELETAFDAWLKAQQESQAASEAAIRETNADRRKELQEAAAKANRKKELARITYARLNKEAEDLVREADRLEISRYELNGGLGF